jgi:hypothetical protein
MTTTRITGKKGLLVQANDLAVGKHYVVHSVKNCPPDSHPVLGQAFRLTAMNLPFVIGKLVSDPAHPPLALDVRYLDFGRKQMLLPCVLDLNTVVRDIGAMVKRLIGSNIEFVIHTAPDLGRVKADPTQVGQVILNLAANARDAMPKPDAGRLVIATANTELGEATGRRHPDVKPGRYAMLSVSDTGSGMSEDVLAHAFEPFFTTKEVGQGTGLGLATVYGIVKQSGGHVEVESKAGEGTTFRVYLPLIEEPTTPVGGEARLAAKGHETILLVEDDDTVRRMTKAIRRQNGYSVLEAADGPEAVRVAESHRGAIHLLLTDLVISFRQDGPPHVGPPQVGHAEQAGADGLPVRPEAHVEEGPGREIAQGQRAPGRAARQVLVLGGADDLAIRVEFRERRHGLGEERREVLRRHVGGVERTCRLAEHSGLVFVRLGDGTASPGARVPCLLAASGLRVAARARPRPGGGGTDLSHEATGPNGGHADRPGPGLSHL